MSVPRRASLLGLPDHLDQATAGELAEAITTLWTTTMGSAPSDLEGDLDACKRWFDPVAQGQRLRRDLSTLTPVPPRFTDPGPPLTFAVGPKTRLVTPEGRCALELLQNMHGEPRIVPSEHQLMEYDRLLAHLYRDWGRHRIQTVAGLLAGSNKPLQIPAAGVVIALLVNRCTTEERALTRFASGAQRRLVDQAFFTPVQVFADELAPSSHRNRSNPQLVSGWMLYEARRRLGDALTIVEARQGSDGKVWIKPGSEGQVIDVLCRDLVRGHRARATPERFARAFDSLVASLRQELPKLAAFGLVHERPYDTQRLRERLMTGLQSQPFLSA